MVFSLVGCLSSDAENQQVLDQLPVERARGITVKAQVGLNKTFATTSEFNVVYVFRQFQCHTRFTGRNTYSI